MDEPQYKTLVNKLNNLQATVEALIQYSIFQPFDPLTGGTPSQRVFAFSNTKQQMLSAIEEGDALFREP